jgi:hypothetical protein
VISRQLLETRNKVWKPHWPFRVYLVPLRDVGFWLDVGLRDYSARAWPQSVLVSRKRALAHTQKQQSSVLACLVFVSVSCIEFVKVFGNGLARAATLCTESGEQLSTTGRRQITRRAEHDWPGPVSMWNSKLVLMAQS